MKYTVLIILASVCWGSVTIFIKTLSAFGLSSAQISLIRVTLAALFYSILTLVKNRDGFKIKLKDIWIFLGTGIGSVVLMNLTYFHTMINSQASVATVLLYTSPIFIMLLSAILFKEKITGRKMLCLGLTVCGCILVADILGNNYTIAPSIIATGLCSGLAYGLYSIFGRYASNRGYKPETITTYTFIVAALASLPTTDMGAVLSIPQQHPEALFWYAGIALVPTCAAYLLYTKGLQGMETGKAGIIVTLDMVIGEIIGISMYGEPANTTKLIGIALVVGATVLFNMKEKKHGDGLRESESKS